VFFTYAEQVPSHEPRHVPLQAAFAVSIVVQEP
jgi:hypothetical protein